MPPKVGAVKGAVEVHYLGGRPVRLKVTSKTCGATGRIGVLYINIGPGYGLYTLRVI